MLAHCVILYATLKMDKIYYQPNHLWKGQKAVKKLKELSGEKPKTVKQRLSRQAFWQVHLPAPKQVDRLRRVKARVGDLKIPPAKY